MVSTDQDFTIVRGDDIAQPFTITLQTGSLDGSESWRFSVRRNKTDTVPLIDLTDTTGGITKDVTTFQPTVVLTPSDTPVASFPISNDDVPYYYGLEMTKDGAITTVAVGKMRVISDVVRD